MISLKFCDKTSVLLNNGISKRIWEDPKDNVTHIWDHPKVPLINVESLLHAEILVKQNINLAFNPLHLRLDGNL